MIKQTKWRSLTAVGISGYKRGWLNKTMLIWALVSGHNLKDKLNNTVVKKLEKYTCSQRALVNHYFGSENCASLHWAQAVTVRSQDLRYKLKVHATTCIGLAIHHSDARYELQTNATIPMIGYLFLTVWTYNMICYFSFMVADNFWWNAIVQVMSFL